MNAGWLFLGGLALWMFSKRGTSTAQSVPSAPAQSFVPQACAAGLVTWTGGKIGAGTECITIAEAVKRSDAIYAPMWAQGVVGTALLPGKLSGEGMFWFR